jgi:hypothetical protein
MLFKFLPAFTVVALAACNSTSSSQPSGENAAHCVAAFNYAGYWYSQGNKDERGMVEMKARSLFEMDNLAKSGRIEMAKHESSKITRRYGKDGKMMVRLLADCITKQNGSAAFAVEKDRLWDRAKTLK